MRRRTFTLLPAAALALTTAATSEVRIRPGDDPAHWAPLTPRKWAFGHGQVVLTERGEAPDGPRRPYEYAIVRQGPAFGPLSLTAEVRIDEPVTRNDRDVVLIFNYRSPTRFHYAHLSQDNTTYPHNGLFVVDDADRVRIDDQWDGTTGAPPAIDDTDWHHVRLDHDPATGRIAVHLDGAPQPLLTATDRRFSVGRAGFGSFDNHGRIREVTLTGRPA
ncbi:hypothetical protein ABT337_10815 [Saccharopolyspora hirsuta]|uniref:hypothetical protein n=1 Tax=Saccharopolyspora hirsuta TaxID=1837 RepID=UPI0033304EDE